MIVFIDFSNKLQQTSLGTEAMTKEKKKYIFDIRKITLNNFV